MLNLQNENLLSLALEATSDGVWAWNIKTGEAYFSHRYYTMLGYEPDELPAGHKTWLSLLHPDDLERTQKTIQRNLEDTTEGFDVEFRLKTKSGNFLWILGRGRVIEWDGANKPVILVGSHINIDKQKRAEQKLETYQKQLQNMVQERTQELMETTSLLEATLNAIPDILGIQNNDHRIIRYNDAGYQFLGKNQQEVVNKRCFELIGRDRECDKCATSMCYNSKQPESVVRYEEALDTWLDVRAYPILDRDGNILKVIEHLRDITPERKAEEEKQALQKQLLSANKMESLGTLAGGIAHDFNNLLMGIQGRVSLMTLDQGITHHHSEHLKEIEEYINGAKNLTKQLLGFARGGKYEVKPVDINDLISTSSRMFGRTRKEIQIGYQLSTETIVVEADKQQLEQVLLNLYINASQAMPDGGTITINTSVSTMDQKASETYQIEPGLYGKISLCDTGHGMDESVRQRVFEPFFTTKEKGRGTGLGLASSYGIIKNHGGVITATSKPDRGSTFDIYLPLSNKSAASDDQDTISLQTGHAAILLIDDEQMILDVGRQMLEKLGYEVITAVGGEKAVKLLEQMSEPFDLIILDMVMPGMDGSKVFDYINKYHTNTPVLLSSGYTIDGQAEAIMKKGCNGFIQKPFTILELSHQVERLFEKQRTA